MSYNADKQVIDTHTVTPTQPMKIPGGQNWPRVKNDFSDSRNVNVHFLVNYSGTPL